MYILILIIHIQGRILTIAGVTTAICSTPFVAFTNLVAIAVWPTWIAVAISETVRKVHLIQLPVLCQLVDFFIFSLICSLFNYYLIILPIDAKQIFI